MVAQTSKGLKYSLEKLGRHYFFEKFVLREEKHFFQFWSASADHLSHLNFGGLFQSRDERRSLLSLRHFHFWLFQKVSVNMCFVIFF